MQGLFKSRKTADGENINVYTEINMSAGGKIDLALTFTNGKPVIVELKHAGNNNDVKNKLEEAENQMKKYTIIQSFTNHESANFLAMVFNQSSESKSELIKSSIKKYSVYHTSESGTSPSSPEWSPAKRSGSPLAGCSKTQRQKRSIGVSPCIDSQDEEITEEQKRKKELIEVLFDTDEIRERAENIEFYDELFKISEEISRNGGVDIDEAFITKVGDVDLNLIDPEVRGICRRGSRKSKEGDSK